MGKSGERESEIWTGDFFLSEGEREGKREEGEREEKGR